MSIKRCTTCNGQKKISPLGFMQKECPTCSGIGFIDTDKPDKSKDKIKVEAKESVVTDKIVKKRGRPPREVL